MASKVMREELERLHGRATSYAQFHEATRGDFQRVARALHRRWALPPAVDAEDVQQELAIAAWQHERQWDPARGMSLEAYVVWTMRTAAKKWLHRQRDAKRRDDRAPSRHDLTFSSLAREGDEDGERTPADRLVEEASQDLAVERRQAVRAFLRGLAPEQRVVFRAVLAERGDLDAAAGRVFADARVCLRERLGSVQDARRYVGQVVAQVLPQSDGGEFLPPPPRRGRVRRADSMLRKLAAPAGAAL